MPNQLYPTLFMLASTFSLSLTGLFSKYLGQYLEPALLSFLRFLIPAAMILLLFRVVLTRPVGELNRAIWIRALCIASCQVCFIYSLNHLSLVESVVLFGTGPLFLPVLERLIFSTKLQWISVVGVIATFGGVLLLAGDVSGVSFRIELLVGLASGLFNAGSQLSLYRISKSKLNALQINLWTFLYAAILLVPYLLFTSSTAPLVINQQTAPIGLICVVLLAVSALIINTQVFRAKAYRLVESGSQLAPLIFTNLLFTALWQAMFFNESYTLTQLLGLTLIVAANMLVVLFPICVARLRPSAI
ncbi:EamA family transporter [Vibrio sp. RE86]|uniref:DMT family transporter n=1 Tax=Vibrio sp. RE86 TaxID=2607605 RepID=UPI0014936A13|nr:DMT family transporter [Vibrio sp. RE86]NOH78320.1 EamA family transporter [Vibrio sp. RE86]